MTGRREVHAPGGPAEPGSIPLAVPNIGASERDAVLGAVESGFVSSVGPAVGAFEDEFARRVGARYAVACTSGTAAIHVALILLGVEPGQDVLCADFTFVGSVNPIAYIGARPVLIDSEPGTWNLDPTLVQEELTRRAEAQEPMPAAVEVVHVLGQPARTAEILATCERFGVPVIEDAAESLGAGWSQGPLAGRETGAVGRIGCFSFNGNKIVTAGGGGMIVTDDPDLAARARHLTTQAKIPDVGYLHDEVGYNYRLTNIAAALGLAQLRRLDEFVLAKRRIAKQYDAALGPLPLTLPPREPGLDSTYWLYSVLLDNPDDRDPMLEHLAAKGVGGRALWRPLHEQPPYRNAERVGGRVSQSLFRRGISLPCSTSLDEDDQQRVVDAIQSFYVR